MNESAAARLQKIKCFLLDMDGTFYLGNQLIEGSLDFLEALEKTGRSALFLTNNSSRSADFYVNKLSRMGVRAPFLNVLTSGQAAARYILDQYPGKSAYLVGNSILEKELRDMGVVIDPERPDFVLLAFDTELTYQKLWRACDLVRAGLPYLATHPDFNCPTESGFMPDIGAMIAFIKASTGREPDVIIGKPHRGIVDEALRITGLPKEQLAMVGDRLYTDIATGLNFGMTSVLVLSGETKKEDLCDTPFMPDLIFNSLKDMIPLLDGYND